jgi:multicomponent Na+:H+ antiporter subunit D
MTPLAATAPAAVDSVVPLLAVLTPLAAAVLIMLSGRWPNLRETWTLLAGLATIGLVAAMLPAALDGRQAQTVLFNLLPGVPVELRADPAGMVFAQLAAVLWLATSVYSIGYMRGLREGQQTRYFAAFAASISCALGVALAGNLLTFVLFYELLTVAPIRWSSITRRRRQSRRAASIWRIRSRAGWR